MIDKDNMFSFINKDDFDILIKENLVDTMRCSWIIDNDNNREGFLLNFKINDIEFNALISSVSFNSLLEFYSETCLEKEKIIHNLIKENNELIKESNELIKENNHEQLH